MDRQVVPYKKEHRDSCIEVFKTNIGKYFDEGELKGFIDFLDFNVYSTQYFVVLLDGISVIGCGGYYLNSEVVRLVDGMIDKSSHKTGPGLLLLEYRLTKAKAEYPGRNIGIDTSQHTEGFFEKYGFKTTESVKDFYGVGIDKVSMLYNP